jgi:Nucleoside-diphosphate-sugar epimerases
MEKVVVIGAAGHIGTYLIPMLVDNGYETIAITRRMSKPYEDAPAWRRVNRVLMDREKDPYFINKIKEMKPDIIVDLVNFNINDTRKIVEAFKGSGLSHYLYCSSCWAHGMAETIPFNPDDLRKEPLDEYGKDKFASEMFLKEQYRKNDFPATIIMPGQISGPGWTIINPWGNTSMRVFQDIADGKK